MTTTACQPKDFFISYNHRDSAWAEWIAWQLENDGYSTIIQAWDFKVGSNFVLEMDRGLRQARRVIAVLSPQYFESNFTPPEWAAIFVKDPHGTSGKLIPVRIQEVPLDGLLSPIVYVDLVGKDEVTARNDLLANLKQERAKPMRAPSFPGIQSSYNWNRL